MLVATCEISLVGVLIVLAIVVCVVWLIRR